ncbi:MAG: ferritin-like domain-containing protein [Acidobacteriaceae bacterium]|nr:ferritin-like domain-containing protein [Acidobacteriaceae bacterium]
MNDSMNASKSPANRRSFLKKGLAVGGASVGAGLLANSFPALAANTDNSGSLGRGDASILRFLAAAELIESDLWVQYNELGGIQDLERPELGGGGNAAYTNALKVLDSDMDQYIHDNTDDELSHADFINAYLKSKGADTVNLDEFRTIPGSKASGALNIPRLTNLMKLTVDTSWYTRYRSSTKNPDLDPGFTFPQAIPGLATGQHPAIPRDNSDLAPQNHIQAIANTAGFHFCFIEQGGSSLYPSLAQRVTDPEVLRILLSIGPTETSHFQTWHDKAGNAVSDPNAPLTDPNDHTLVFPNLNTTPGGEDFQTNLIMPEPCPFLDRKFPKCSIIRPTQTKGAAMGAVKALMADGLFIGQQNKEFFELLFDLAADADAARRDQ